MRIMNPQLDTVLTGMMARNASGEIELVIQRVPCTEEDQALGTHLGRAETEAEAQGYQHPMIAFDGADPAARRGLSMAAFFVTHPAQLQTSAGN